MSLIETYLSIEKIKNDFAFTNGDGDIFTGSINFSTQNSPCDVYIRATAEDIKQIQVDNINGFQLNYKSLYKEIDSYIINHLELIERRYYTRISNSKLNFNVIEVHQKEDKNDLLLICSKRYKSLIFKRMISIQVEIINGKIHKIKRSKRRLQSSQKVSHF